MWWQLLPDLVPLKEEPAPSFPLSSDRHCREVFPSQMKMKPVLWMLLAVLLQLRRPVARTARLQIRQGVDRQDTGTSISSALLSASHGDLPSPSPGPCLTCWTARQPRHSPPSATPPVLPSRDSQGGGGHHNFALALYCLGAHVPVWRAASARDSQLREHLLCVGATFSRLFRPQPFYSCFHLQPALPFSVPQEIPLFLPYVPLLSHHATGCVPLDHVPHLHSVAYLSLQATDGDQDQNMQTTEMIPFHVFKNNFFKKNEVIVQAQLLDKKVDPIIVIVQAQFMENQDSGIMQDQFKEKQDSVIVQARFAEEKVDPVLIAQQELEQG